MNLWETRTIRKVRKDTYRASVGKTDYPTSLSFTWGEGGSKPSGRILGRGGGKKGKQLLLGKRDVVENGLVRKPVKRFTRLTSKKSHCGDGDSQGPSRHQEEQNQKKKIMF